MHPYSILLSQPCTKEDVYKIFNNTIPIRVALVSEPGIIPGYSILPELYAYNLLTSDDYEELIAEQKRKQQVIQLLKKLSDKWQECTLALFLFSLLQHGYAEIAKQIHDEWHGADEELRDKRYSFGKCLPIDFLAPELKGAKPKISIGVGFFSVDKKGAVQIKNKVGEAFLNKGSSIKLMINDILLGAEEVSPSYYCVLVQKSNRTFPENTIIRYYSEALYTKYLVIHIKASKIAYKLSTSKGKCIPKQSI
jgi:hypothetical protein